MTPTPRVILGLGIALAGAVSAAVGFEEARNGIGGDAIRGHLYFLSHDQLRGRAPGTRGGDVAAEYVASQFMRMGLQPVAGSHFQPVPLAGITVDPEATVLAFEAGDQRLVAHYPGDAVVWPGRARADLAMDGELVFVGYGVDAPRWQWDDFKGRDLTGKVAVFLVGDPPTPPDEPDLFDGRALTYYGRWTYKLEEARRRGAAGALIVHRPDAAGYEWSVVASSFTGEQLLATGDDEDPPLPLNGWITEDFARRLFAMAGLDLAELYVRAARRDFRPVATGLNARARIGSRPRRLATRNVVALLPGSSPSLRDEIVVLTSHYDHLGVGTPVDGDSVYNGAYDNASGVALLMEVAEAFSRLDRAPDRSLLFIATAAEEAGLLGSRHYVANPLFPLRRTVAAFNVDGANLWGETHDVIALGGEDSTLGEILQMRAAELELVVEPDPAPEKGSFFRSDHFPFARAGVPVLYLEHGIRYRDRPEGWGEDLMRRYQAGSYHAPSDEYDPALDMAGAVQQGRLLFGVVYDVAMAETPPRWRDGSPYASPRERTRR